MMAEQVTPALIDKHLRDLGMRPDDENTEEMFARLQPLLGWTNNPSLSPRTRMEQEKRLRREIANSNERRRMQSINAGFQSLKSLLPKREGEKMSKASILQQTAQLIKTLQNDKSQLLQQNMQYKQLMELRGLVIPQPVSGSDKPKPCPIKAEVSGTDEAHHEGQCGTNMAPPKKRKCYGIKENVDSSIADTPADETDSAHGSPHSSDSGKGASPPQNDQSPSSTAPPARPLPANPLPNKPVEEPTRPAWELDHMRRELRDLRLAFEHERRARAVLEDHVRRDELNKQIISRLNSAQQAINQPAPFTPLLDFAMPHLGNQGLLQVPTPTRPKNTGLLSIANPFAATPMPAPVARHHSVDQLLRAAEGASTLTGQGLTLPLAPGVEPPKNLESIVAAIQHLEGRRQSSPAALVKSSPKEADSTSTSAPPIDTEQAAAPGDVTVSQSAPPKVDRPDVIVSA